MKDERFHDQGDQGEPLVAPGSEERAYVLRGSLPPKVWDTIAKQMGFAFGINLEQVDHQAEPVAQDLQAGRHDLPEFEDDEAKAEKSIYLNQEDFRSFAVEHGYPIPLASRAWNALTEFYERKQRLLEISKRKELSRQKDINETMPIEFAGGTQDDRSNPDSYRDLKLESLVQLIERIEKCMGPTKSKYALNRALDIVSLRNAGAKSFDFYKALVDHYLPQDDQPEQPQS